MVRRSLGRDARWFAWMLVTISCGGADTGERRSVTMSMSALVSATGATIAGPMGASVDVPADAVTSDVTITVSALRGVRAPRGTAAVAGAIRLEPAGTTFEKAVEVTIPIQPADLQGKTLDDVVVVRSEQDSTTFVPLPTRRAATGNAVVAITEHFSDFLPVLVDSTLDPFQGCGDAVCDANGETCDSCPSDCGICLAANECGNGVCEGTANERCSTCAFDCGDCPLVCGDGVLAGAEACDDGNTVANDGCGATCAIESGYACPTPGTSCMLLVACGNGALQVGEGCDDGNTTASDGCDSICQVELGYVCPVAGQACMLFVICGDGVLQGSEVCDDLNAASNDGCSATCQLESGYVCPIAGMPCMLLASCGDGVLQAGETCDDGDSIGGDGCSMTCAPEAGFTCDGGSPSVCVDDDECMLGTAGCDANAACTNSPGSYSCACNGGYIGNGITCTAACSFSTAATGSLLAARGGFIGGSYSPAVRLPDGTVLVVGGNDPTELSTVERFDPMSGTWSSAASMSVTRSTGHTVTLLQDGRVLVQGGVSGGVAVASSELYDPAANSWSPTMNAKPFASIRSTATLLDDGRVLVTGGLGAAVATASAAIFDPTSDTWSSIAAMPVARDAHTATKLADGRVLIVGGRDGGGVVLNSTVIFTPGADTFSPGPTLASVRERHGAERLPNGNVLIMGGFASGAQSATVEVYDVPTNQFLGAASLPVTRYEFASIALADGRVLVTGGGVGSSATYLYDGFADTWTPGPTMTASRYRHFAAQLQDGRVLIGAGQNSPTTYLASSELLMCP